jgi:hypothetical protein
MEGRGSGAACYRSMHRHRSRVMDTAWRWSSTRAIRDRHVRSVAETAPIGRRWRGGHASGTVQASPSLLKASSSAASRSSASPSTAAGSGRIRQRHDDAFDGRPPARIATRWRQALRNVRTASTGRCGSGRACDEPRMLAEQTRRSAPHLDRSSTRLQGRRPAMSASADDAYHPRGHQSRARA